MISTEMPYKKKFQDVKGKKIAYVEVGEGTHFIQEDSPKEIGQAVAQWLDTIN